MGERRGTKALELWCKRVTDGYSGVKVENMTTSWRDGLAFCALIHHFRPDLINFSALDKSDVYGNNDLAFRTAERHLGIPALLDAEDMVEYPVPDRLSVLTYLSQFYQVFASQSTSPGKRTSDSPDRPSLVMSSTGGPTPASKIGAGVGRCKACEQSVFIAQRFVINGQLYHRVCFRCARCNSQLSMANCYETQNAQFVCETCPDEECIDQNWIQKIDSGHASPTQNNSNSSDVPVSSNEVSDAVSEKNVNLVDTNKRRSLVSHRKMLFENIAVKEMNIVSLTDDAKATKAARKLGTNDAVNTNINLKNIVNMSSKSIDDVIENSNLNSDKLQKVSNDQDELSKVCDDSLSISNHDNFCESICNSDNNDTKQSLSDLSDVSDSNTLPEKNSIDSTLNLEHSVEPISDQKPSFNSLPNSENLSCLEKTALKTSDDSLLSNDEGINSIISRCSNSNSDVVLSLETVDLNDSHPDTSLVVSENDEISDDSKVEMPLSAILNEHDESIDSAFDSKTNPIPDATAIPQALSEKDEDHPAESLSTLSVEEVSESENLENVESVDHISENVESVDHISEENSPLKSDKIENDNEGVVNIEEETKSNSSSEYDEKNPFSCEKPLSKKPPAVVTSQKGEEPKSRNPFGDFDDDEEEGEDKIVSPMKDKPKVSTNPFGSDSEDEEPEPAEKPVPKTRTSIPASRLFIQSLQGKDISESQNSQNSTPTPLPRKLKLEDSTPPVSRHRRQGSTSSITSTASTATLSPHKKKLAPMPPGSVLSPRYRKSKPAPPPPVSPASVSTVSLSSLQSTPSSPSPCNKADKDSANRLQQTESPPSFEPHKSVYGQWKRKKGPAPQRPIPIKRQVREPISLNQIKQELSDIEIKQQELERQGVNLEQSIRNKSTETNIAPAMEDMMTQLFELVNEKNELQKRQSELMFLRRQYNLEQEHADLEYRIRCLMLCPEANKTDTDKELEEQLIQRLVEVVERRNEIVEDLEIDRRKEIEGDKSCSSSLELYSFGSFSDKDSEVKDKTLKKKDKKAKKEKKGKKIDDDVDKDTDTTDTISKKSSKYKWFGTLRHLPKKL